jgi:hypothetical protein
MSICWTGLTDVESAVAFARGVPGVMRPSPDAAESEDALNLLRYAAAIAQADEPTPPKKPEWKPKWFWNFVGKIALKYWEWRYHKEAEARIRQWYESDATARSHTQTGATVQPNTKKDSSR